MLEKGIYWGYVALCRTLEMAIEVLEMPICGQVKTINGLEIIMPFLGGRTTWWAVKTPSVDRITGLLARITLLEVRVTLSAERGMLCMDQEI